MRRLELHIVGMSDFRELLLEAAHLFVAGTVCVVQLCELPKAFLSEEVRLIAPAGDAHICTAIE